MKNAVLVLCPEDPHWTPPDKESLVQLLQSIQLIGAPLNDQMYFLTGDKFLDLIAFMGCSPDIKLEPADDTQPFCHVHLMTSTGAIEFHSGNQTHVPRCPQCRSPVSDWKSKIGSWLENRAENTWSCEACRHKAEPWQYNWRKSAGFGRCFIEINNIFPKEAAPQQQLLDTLHSHYGVNWHYFYQY